MTFPHPPKISLRRRPIYLLKLSSETKRPDTPFPISPRRHVTIVLFFVKQRLFCRLLECRVCALYRVDRKNFHTLWMVISLIFIKMWLILVLLIKEEKYRIFVFAIIF